MNLNEIRYNIVFEYTKDIRRYAYDMEEFLKSIDLCGEVVPSPPVPDEIEPTIPRLNIIKQLNGRIYSIVISQISISIAIQYQGININLNDIDNEIKLLKENCNKIKNYCISKINNFRINFEGLIIVSSKIFINPQDIKILKVLKTNDEVRDRIGTEVNSNTILIEEKSALKTYKLISRTINPILIKNKDENLLGWNVVLFKEINNRLEYNNEVSNSKNNELDFEASFLILKEKFNKDLS